LFRTFDFASPDTSSPMRYFTTVPQQALFLMNSPFIVEQARALTARPELQAQKTAADRVQALYRLVYGREAAPDEVILALRYLKGAESLGAEGTAGEGHVWQYGYGEVDE